MADAAVTDQPIEAEPPAVPQSRRIAYRHRLPTRIWHWINALTVIVMLMSGLMILNAHPRLYWGQFGANFDHAWVDFGPRPFPGWATIPSTYNLAAARRWHLAFAWILVGGLILFLLTSLWNRWGMRNRLVSIPLTLRNLEYPKGKEKPPFQTWREIERCIALGGLTAAQAEELWDSLYLRKEELAELLAHVRGRAPLPWIYPLFCTACHTSYATCLYGVYIASVKSGFLQSPVSQNTHGGLAPPCLPHAIAL